MKIYVLYGGPSSEREVSFGTKDFFMDLYKEFNPIEIEWPQDDLKGEFVQSIDPKDSIVVNASHGEYVEDGYIQSIFEKKGIAYTGSDAKSCALSMDKEKSQKTVKKIVETIPTTRDPKDLDFPFIAKPNAKGSSVGIYLISNQAELSELDFSEDYIFQPFIKGTEVSLGSVREGDSFMELFPTEIIPKSDFFDYSSKYDAGGAEEITPARISQKETAKLREITNRVHDALGLGYYSRSDFIISEGSTYYLETNSLPGMTKTSLIPQQLRYSDKLDVFKSGLLEFAIRTV